MQESLPVCGPTNPLRIAILQAGSQGINQTKLNAATSYIENRIAPIVSSVESDIEAVVLVNYLLLVFIALVAIVIIVLWVCMQREIQRVYVVGILLLIFIMAIVSFFAFERYVSSALSTASTEVLRTLRSQFAAGELLLIVNGAAQEYLATLFISC